MKEQYMTNSNSKKNRPVSRQLMVACVLVGAIAFGYLLLDKATNQPKVNLEGLEVISYNDAVEAGLETAADKQVLAVSLDLDLADRSKITIAEIKSYTNGVPILSNNESGEWQVEIKKDGGQVYLDYFNAPNEVVYESIDPETGEFKREEGSKTVTIPLTLPWFGDNSELFINDSKGNNILKYSLKDVETVSNTPDYKIYR